MESLSVYLTAAILFLEIGGYRIYIRYLRKEETDPNPTTWFMVAYGSMVMFALEGFAIDASDNFSVKTVMKYAVVLQPVLCFYFNLQIMRMMWRQGRWRAPNSMLEWIALILDLMISVILLLKKGLDVLVEKFGLYGLIDLQFIPSTQMVFVLLVLSNLSMVLCFLPLLDSVRKDRTSERVTPWIIWLFSYFALIWLTAIEHGWHNELMIYPVLSAVLHLAVLFFIAFGRTPTTVSAT